MLAHKMERSLSSRLGARHNYNNNKNLQALQLIVIARYLLQGMHA